MRQLIIALAASALGPSACGAGDISGERDMTDVPGVVRQIMAAGFSEDGQIHAQSRGTFKIQPNTLFCEMDASLDPDIRKLGILGIGIDGDKLAAAIKGLGYSYYLDGSPRQRLIRSGQCPQNDSNIVYRGYAKLNRNNTPYKLVLAVWQGDPAEGGAYWLGVLERTDGKNLNAHALEKPPEIGDGECCDPKVSIVFDSRILSNSFVEYILGGS